MVPQDRDRQGEPRVKVAVLGGGMGALAAAWQLVRLDASRYDITVYQRGWRLGGKGGSGRNLEPGKALRIEEHGLHILMGFYDHVFHILKTCYDELGATTANPPWQDVGPWSAALVGSSCLQISDRYRDGSRAIWEIHLPAHEGEVPGDRVPGREPDVAEWLRKGFAFLYETLVHAGEEPGSPPSVEHTGAREKLRWLQRIAETIVAREPGRGGLAGDMLCDSARTGIRWALALIFRRMGDPERRDRDSVARRRQAMAAWFIGANLLGIIEHRLWRKADFLRVAERLDELDYRAWLRQNVGPVGDAWPELTVGSPLVAAIYDLIFSNKAGFGAGTALYDTLSMLLDYWGHLFYRMNGGMGDVVFAPLYLWLRQRGVKFRFFQRVRALRPEVHADPARVGEILMEEQLELNAPYEPLIAANGRPCWPSEPLLEQLPVREQRRLRTSGYELETDPATFGRLRTLTRGRDFDAVVLGIPVGAMQAEPELIGALSAVHAPLGQMVRGVQTVATRALQVWTHATATELGWAGTQAMLGSGDGPFSSWGDMSQVLPRECWNGVSARAVHYFCDAHEEDDAPGAPTVGAQAQQFLEQPVRRWMPGFSWDTVVASGEGIDRLAGQYVRANVAGSERYVLAAPGTSRHRLAADRSGFENLFLAGDWVKTELNAGCVEAAAMAGVAAGRALHARPAIVPALPRAVVPGALHLYVDGDGDWVLRHPVRIERATTAAFLLRGDPDALTALCHAQVDGPSGGAATARPWPSGAGLVLLACSDLPRVASGDSEHGALGYFHEHDVSFFVPVEVRTATGGHLLALLCPYLFVDSMVGVIAGREIFGLPKLLARIDMPAATAAGFAREPHIVVVSDVLESGGGPTGGEVHPGTIVEVSPSDRAAAVPDPGLWRMLPSLMSGALVAGRRMARGMRLDLPMLTLKQFRDASETRSACYQKLLLCPASAHRLGSVTRWRRRFTVRIPHHAKPNVAGALGLPHELDTRMAMHLTHDLEMPRALPLCG